MKDSIGFCRVILNYHLLVTRNELVLDSRSHLCREKKKFEKIYSGNKLDRCKLLSFERNLSLVINSSLPLVFRYYSNGGRRGGEGESKSDENIPISPSDGPPWSGVKRRKLDARRTWSVVGSCLESPVTSSPLSSPAAILRQRQLQLHQQPTLSSHLHRMLYLQSFELAPTTSLSSMAREGEKKKKNPRSYQRIYARCCRDANRLDNLKKTSLRSRA